MMASKGVLIMASRYRIYSIMHNRGEAANESRRQFYLRALT